MIQIGIINSSELMELFGSDTNKISYAKDKVIYNNTKQSLINKAKLKCNIIDLGGGKYEILEIYEKPLPKSMLKIQENEVYSVLAPLLIYKLIESKNNNANALELTLIDYFDNVEVVNRENYNKIRYNTKKIVESFDINLKNIETFVQIANEKLRYYLEECLNLLQNSDIIIWQKVIAKEIRENTIQNNYEEVNLTVRHIKSRATQEEIRFIEDCKAEIQLKYNILNSSAIRFHSKANKEYHELLMKQNIRFDFKMYEVYYRNFKKCEDFMVLFKSFDLKKYSEILSTFLIDNIKKSYNFRGIDPNEKEFVKIKANNDYIFLSEKALNHTATKIEIETTSIEIKGNRNTHNIISKSNE